MPNPHNSNQMFKLSHQALVIWAKACVNGLAMLSTPPNNEEFHLEVEKSLIQDKDKPKEDLSSGGDPPVFGGFINEDTDTKSDSSKSSSDIEVINQTVYQFETFLTDAGVNQDNQHTQKILTDAGLTNWTDFLLTDHTSMFDLESLDLEPETAQNLVFQARLYNAIKM
ncbi:hypothetical protein CROQUDRAFT_100848 [Cronartium quercuum f. sp. fusiforme G11]|uniref:Uncharacterized protein n=1 Tax=Cronartium quercuum f. sp. fusiforme G11 TaxID=708437 RepID=A0A9P6N5T5_9BASI|nr:hypothetical protein CROQUDRAFT_100848 [Cronartium quercuum f. sp. fusiforme G11]